jgi:hypothetical protein
MNEAGVGAEPLASAFPSVYNRTRALTNRPQDSILPHKATEPQPNHRRQDRQRYKIGAACDEIQV